jgi:hypothetical protein
VETRIAGIKYLGPGSPQAAKDADDGFAASRVNPIFAAEVIDLDR